MTVEYGDINYFAVLVGIVINMAVGALWYSPFAFSKDWMALTGVTKEYLDEHKDEMYKGYAVSVVASVFIVFSLAVVVQLARATSAADGLLLGLYAGIGFVAATQAANYTFEARPMRLFLINIGYSVVTFAIIGTLLALWD
ncbi:MAG: DUF1761 domain-containing protein [Chloroflexi bacterium]|nr:DUF1761 domain-containing protein [Chloroflexota bacterium]